MTNWLVSAMTVLTSVALASTTSLTPVVEDEIQISGTEIVISTTTPTVVEEVKPKGYCSCVSGAIAEGANIPLKNASEFIGDTTADIGKVIIIQYANAWHVAVIIGFTEVGYKVVDWNYVPCERTIRVIPYNDSRIRGFTG